MSEELQSLIDEVNNCTYFQDDNLKQDTIGFVKSLENFNKEFYSQLSHLNDLKARLNVYEMNCFISVLRKAIKLESSSVRSNAIQTLGALQTSGTLKGPSEQEKLVDKAVPELVELIINEKNEDICKEAAIVLAKIGSVDSQNILKLIDHLENQPSSIQPYLITAISKLKEYAAPGVPNLRNFLLNTTEKNVITAIISCFGEIGPSASQVLPDLVKYLEPTRNKETRLATAQSLARIGIVENAIPYLIDGLKPQEELDLRVTFVQTLGKSNLEIDRIVQALSAYTDDQNLGPVIIDILFQMNSASSAKILIDVLLEGNPDLVTEKLHLMEPNGDWQLKPTFMVDAINQKILPARAYSGLASHMFHAMLRPSNKNITQKQKISDVTDLCQILISKAVENKKNRQLTQIIANLISQGARLTPEELKEQFDLYTDSRNIPLDEIEEIRVFTGDTSVLESKISKLESELSESWKEALKALQQEVKDTYKQAVQQYNETVWMNRVIFGFGLTVGVLSAIYFFYSLLIAEQPDQLKSILSGGGTLAGFVALYTLLFYKPQKQGTEALKNLLQNKAVMLGFTQDMIFIAEQLKRLPKDTSNLDDIQKGSQHIQNAYRNASNALEQSIK